MISNRKTPWAAALALCFVPGLLAADSMRCGRKVLRTGDSSAMLQRHCGSPLYKDSGKETVKLDEGRRSVRVERWHYKKSSRSLERIVMVYRGRVVAMETGGR
jgi:hypothetical protein